MAKATKDAKIIDAEPVNGSGGASGDAPDDAGARSGGGSGLALVLSGLALLISLVALGLNLLPQPGVTAPGADAEAVAALDARLAALETAPAPVNTGDGAAAAAAMEGLDALGARFAALQTETSTTLERLDDALATYGEHERVAEARYLRAALAWPTEGQSAAEPLLRRLIEEHEAEQALEREEQEVAYSFEIRDQAPHVFFEELERLRSESDSLDPQMAPPAEHPFLRLTRTLEEGHAVTIEPGLYFIPMLLDPLRESCPEQTDWDLVDALIPFGGVRIEDNVVATSSGPRNLTREAFAGLED